MNLFIRTLLVVSLAAVSQGASRQPDVPSNGFAPKAGFVPTAAVAEAIAEAVLIPVYGTHTVAAERPFKAELHGGFWIVRGKVPCEGSADAVCPGGAGEVWISKRTGRVLFMTHLQ